MGFNTTGSNCPDDCPINQFVSPMHDSFSALKCWECNEKTNTDSLVCTDDKNDFLGDIVDCGTATDTSNAEVCWKSNDVGKLFYYCDSYM